MRVSREGLYGNIGLERKLRVTVSCRPTPRYRNVCVSGKFHEKIGWFRSYAPVLSTRFRQRMSNAELKYAFRTGTEDR